MFDEKSSRAKLTGVKPQNKGAEFNKMLEDFMAPQKPKIAQPKPEAKTTKSPKLVGKATPESVGKLLHDTKFTWEVAKRVPGSLPNVMAEYDRQNPTATPQTRERIKRATILGNESGLDYNQAMERALVADALPAAYDFGDAYGLSDSTDLRNMNDVAVSAGLENRRLRNLAFRKAWISEQQRVSTPENMVFGDVFLDPDAALRRKRDATFGEIVVENYIQRHGVSRTLNGGNFASDAAMLGLETVVSPFSTLYEYGTREEEKDDWSRMVTNAMDFLPGIVTGGAAAKAGTWAATKIGAKLGMKGIAKVGIAGAASRILAKGGIGAGSIGAATDFASGLVAGAYSASPGNISLGFQRMGGAIGGMVAGLGDAEKWKSNPGGQANAAVQTAVMAIGLLAGAASARNVYKNLLSGDAPPHGNPVVAAADTLAEMDGMGLDGAVATAVAQIAKDVDLETPVHGGIADRLTDLESQGVDVPASLIDAAPVLDAAVRKQAEKDGIDVDEATAAAALEIVEGIKSRADLGSRAKVEPTVINARKQALDLLNGNRITPTMAKFVEDNFDRGTMLPADPDAAVKAITAAMARKAEDAATAAAAPKPKRQSTAQKLREAAEKATDDVEAAKSELDAAHNERIGSAPKRRSSRSKQGGYVDLGAFAPPTLKEMQALVKYIAAKIAAGGYDLAATVAELGSRFDTSTLMRARAHALGARNTADLASYNVRVDGKLHELTGQAAREVKALRDEFMGEYLGASGSTKMELQGKYYAALRILLESHDAGKIMDELDLMFAKSEGDTPAKLKARLDEINHDDVAVVLKWLNRAGDVGADKLESRMNNVRKTNPLKTEDIATHLGILVDLNLVVKTLQPDGSVTYKVNSDVMDKLLSDKGIGPKLVGKAVAESIKQWKRSRGQILAEALYDPGLDLASEAFIAARAAGGGEPGAVAKAWFDGASRSQEAYQTLVDGIAELQVKIREGSQAKRVEFAGTAAGWVKTIEAIWDSTPEGLAKGYHKATSAAKQGSVSMYSTAEYLFKNYGTVYKEFMDTVRADIEAGTAAAKHIEIASATWLRDRWYRKDEFVRKLAGDLAAGVRTFDDFEIGMRGRGFSDEQIASVVDDIDRFRNIADELRNSVNQSRALRGEKLVGDLGDEYFTAAYASRGDATAYDPGQATIGNLTEGGRFTEGAKVTGKRPGLGLTNKGTIEGDATRTRSKKVTDQGRIDFIDSAEGYIRDMSYEAAMGSAWDKLVIAKNLIEGHEIEKSLSGVAGDTAQNIAMDPAVRNYFEEQIKKIAGKNVAGWDAGLGSVLSLTKLPFLAFNLGSVSMQLTAIAPIGGQSGTGLPRAIAGAAARTARAMKLLVKVQGYDALSRMNTEPGTSKVPELGSAWLLSEQLRSTYADVPRTGTGKGFRQRYSDANTKGLWMMTKLQDSMYRLAFESNFYSRLNQLQNGAGTKDMPLNEMVETAVKYADRELRTLYPVAKEDRGTLWDSPTMRNAVPFAQEMTQVADRMIAEMFPRYDEFGNRIKWNENFKAAAKATARNFLVMQGTALLVNFLYQQTLGQRPIPFDLGGSVLKNVPGQPGEDPGAEDIGVLDHAKSVGLEMAGDLISTNALGRLATTFSDPYNSPRLQEAMGVDQPIGGAPGISTLAKTSLAAIQGDWEKAGQSLSLLAPAGLQLQKTWGGVAAMMEGEIKSGDRSYAMDEGGWAWVKASLLGAQTASHAYKAAKAAKRRGAIRISNSSSEGLQGLGGISGLKGLKK